MIARKRNRHTAVEIHDNKSALGFLHSVAGSVEAFYLAASGQGTWGAMLGDFVLPSVVGNAVGGVLLVAC